MKDSSVTAVQNLVVSFKTEDVPPRGRGLSGMYYIVPYAAALYRVKIVRVTMAI